jgi:hypothetical protein
MKNRNRKLDEIADDFARQTTELGYRRLDEATHIVGTAIDAGEQPFSKELFLQSEAIRD